MELRYAGEDILLERRRGERERVINIQHLYRRAQRGGWRVETGRSEIEMWGQGVDCVEN